MQETMSSEKKMEKESSNNTSFMQVFKSMSKLNLVYTVFIFFSYFGYGITCNIWGSAMVDLAKVYDVSLTVMSNGLIVNSVGYMAGTLVPWSYRWLNRQLVYSLFVVLLGVTNMLLPVYGSVWAVYLFLTLIGVSMGVIASTASMWLIDLYPESITAAVLQVQVFCYGLGTILAPIIAAPFVYGTKEVTEDGEPLTAELRQQKLMVPFAINGALQAIPGLIMIVLFFTHRYRPPVVPPSTTMGTTGSQQRSSSLPRKSIDLTRRGSVFAPPAEATVDDLVPNGGKTVVRHRKAKLALGCLCLAMYFTAEIGYFPYVSTCWQYMEVRLTASEAAMVMSVLSATYTIGPLITAAALTRLQVEHILAYHYGFLFLGVGVLYFGRLSRPMIYAGSALLGYGMSAMIAGLTAFSNRHLTLSNRVASLFSFTSGTVSMAIPVLIGQFLETQPIMLLYLAAGFIAFSLVLFVLMRLWLACSTSNSSQVTVEKC